MQLPLCLLVGWYEKFSYSGKKKREDYAKKIPELDDFSQAQ